MLCLPHPDLSLSLSLSAPEEKEEEVKGKRETKSCLSLSPSLHNSVVERWDRVREVESSIPAFDHPD